MSGKPTRRVWVMVAMALVVISSIVTLMSGAPWVFPAALIVAAVAVGVWAWRGSPQRPNKRIF